MPAFTSPVSPISPRPRMRRAELCAAIGELAHELGAGAKMPTTVQMRERFGGSLATIDAALGELEAREIITRRQGSGIYVAPTLGRCTIALVSDAHLFRGAHHTPFWDLLVEASRNRAAQKNETFRLHLLGWKGDEGEDRLHEEIEQGRIQGIIGAGLTVKDARALESCGVPFVALGNPVRYAVTLDAEAFVRTGVQLLAEQGCKRPAFWEPLQPYSPTAPSQNRFYESERVWKQALTEHNLQFDTQLLENNRSLAPKMGDITTQSHSEQGYHTAMRVFCRSRKQWPDGILVGDDMMTRGVFAAFNQLGLVPGKELPFVSHSNRNSPVLLGYEHQLWRLEFDPKSVVSCLFQTLERLSAGEIPVNSLSISPTVHPPVSL